VRQSTLEQVLAASGAGEPVVLVRGLDRAVEWLVDRKGSRRQAENFPRAVVEQAQQALSRDGAEVFEAEGERYLLQTLAPAPRLIVVGAVHIAQKLIPMARLAGFEVVLIDPRSAFASSERFPEIEIVCEFAQDAMRRVPLHARTALVTLSHDAKIDEPALAAALRSEAFYVGALGSKKNHAKRLERLAALGFSPETLARIAAPIGLPLGGRSPAEIAVAILAQIVAARYRGRVDGTTGLASAGAVR
jgi:xanthine dehydrogenase accessory factor